MANGIVLSAIDNWAVRTEIGERLRTILPVDYSRLPAEIENRLAQLRELDDDRLSPSITPSMDARLV
jgi:hypothetical protein